MSKSVFHIVLTGPESTGKSSLAKALADRLDAPVVGEYLRDYFTREGRVTLADAIPIAQGQWHSEAEAVQSLRPDQARLVCDTDLVSSLIYTAHYYAHQTSSTAWQDWQIWSEAHRQKLMAGEHGPRLYLLCDIDWPWVADGQRDAPLLRTAFHEQFHQTLITLGLPFLIVSGSLEARLAQSLAQIAQFQGLTQD